MDSIAEVAVFGIPSETFGEEICAAIVARDGTEVTLEGVREHCAGVVTKFKLPKKVVLMPDLPKSANGKVLKRELRDQASK